MPTFISESAFLRVGFPPERFGLTDGWQEHYDENGNLVRPRVPYPAVVFQNGRADVDEATAGRMRNHAGFGSRFQEMPAEDISALSTLQVKPGATMPENGLDDGDLELMETLESLASAKHLAPKQKTALLEAFSTAVVRFQVHGAKAPKDSDGNAAIQVRARDLIELLQETGIWNGEPEPEHSGGVEGPAE